VHPWCVLVADLDRLSTLDVANHPSWFENNPRVGLCSAGRATLRYLSAADEQENVIILNPCESRKQMLRHSCFDM
jgi:hypothetical protein